MGRRLLQDQRLLVAARRVVPHADAGRHARDLPGARGPADASWPTWSRAGASAGRSRRRSTTSTRACRCRAGPSSPDDRDRPRLPLPALGAARPGLAARARRAGLAAALAAKMDRRYPLWECHVIEGLERGPLVAVHEGPPLARSTASAASGSCAGSSPSTPPPATCCRRGPSAPTAPTSPATPPTARDVEEARRRVLGRRARPWRGGVRSGAAVAGSLGRTYAETVTGRRDDDRAAPFRAPRSIFNGRIHTPAPVRDPALPDRPAARRRQGRRRQPQRRLPRRLRRRAAPLPHRAGRPARRRR